MLLTMTEMSKAITEHRIILELNGYKPNTQDARFAVAQAQHEKSFKAGIKQGKKEVVEWGEEICPHEVDTLPHFHKRECPKCWQALRREAGLTD